MKARRLTAKELRKAAKELSKASRLTAKQLPLTAKELPKASRLMAKELPKARQLKAKNCNGCRARCLSSWMFCNTCRCVLVFVLL